MDYDRNWGDNNCSEPIYTNCDHDSACAVSCLLSQDFLSAYIVKKCGNNTACINNFLLRQNFESFVMQLKIQNKTFVGSSLFNSSKPGLSVEVSSATSKCVKVLPDPEDFPIHSGKGNGVQVLVDLETFDNGNLDLMGDGLNILVTDAHDYSLTELHGFSVGPGSAVDIIIRPLLYTTTQSALDNFNYVQRKCVDEDRDLGPDKGLKGVPGNYSLSNCLVSATLTEISKM